MRQSISSGYHFPDLDSIQVDEVVFKVGNQRIEQDYDGDVYWDYETPVSCSFKINVNLELFTSTAGFSPIPDSHLDKRFSVHIGWFSTGTKQRGSSEPISLSNGNMALSVEVPGVLLGGDFKASVNVVLSDNHQSENDSKLCATQIGSRLWCSGDFVLPLEGVGAKFSLTTKNFDDLSIEPIDAMWRVEIQQDLNLPIETGIRVSLNTANKLTVEMLEKPDGPRAKIWKMWLESDIRTQMLLNALIVHQRDELDDEFDAGSLGEALQQLVKFEFPEKQISEIISDPALISAVAQASTSKALPTNDD